MSTFLGEVDSAFAKFSAKWPQDAAAAHGTLNNEAAKYLASYRRLVSLQAWRDQLLNSLLSDESLQFFIEAQNDALLSHIAARQGMWRPALQSLRACVENVLACLYYKDHQIELRLWSTGKHRQGVAELLNYFSTHPELDGIAHADCGLDALREEYSTLSRAVHGSAASFRMTEGSYGPAMWIADSTRLGKWTTREKELLRAINLLLTALFRAKLTGTQLPGLRQAVGLAVPRSSHARISQNLGVTLRTS